MNKPNQEGSTKDPAGVDVGKRLRELREARRMSLREAARRSGVSVNALSLIERGISSPSVSTLYRLVDALNVPITAIFRAETDHQDIVFRSKSQRTKVAFPLGLWEGLGGEAFTGRVQPFMLSLERGGDSGTRPMIHTGHEFVYCLQGSLDYEVEGNLFQLTPGDSLIFAARLTHRWRNTGELEAQAIIVLSGFEEYESPMDFHLSKE